MWPFNREKRHGATCPACGSVNTYLYVNKTALSWQKVGKIPVNIEVPGIDDAWRCKDCKSVFKLQ